MSYHPVCRLEEIPLGQGRAFEFAGKTIAVFHAAEGIYAIEDQCPHMGASLAAGYLENCVVACPWHAWRFDIRDGTWRDNPRVKIDSFPVHLNNGWICVGSNPQNNSMESANENSRLSAETVAFIQPENPMPTSDVANQRQDVSLNDFQSLIHRMYYEKDVARGVEGTFMWLMQEIGELATSLRENDPQNRAEEFADVLAWLATIANVCNVDLATAVRDKYGQGCPGCHKLVCVCPNSEKP